MIRGLRWLGSVLLLAAIGAGGWVLGSPPVLEPGYILPCSTRVVDRNGQTLRVLTTVNGIWRLPVAGLPGNRDPDAVRVDPAFIRMLLACEDKRFFSHPGVDPLALARAAWQWLRHGRIVSGGSTITMQVVRLLHPHPRTLAGKLWEMGQALRLEGRLSKREILALYLTLAPYGGNIQGIEAACRLYFNGSAARITPSRAALLISLPQSPERRRPDRHPQQAQTARDRVLTRLVRSGLLLPDQAELARLQSVPGRRFTFPFIAPHLSGSLHRNHPGKQVIKTTLDADLQRRVETIVHQAWQELGGQKDISLAVMVVDNGSREVLAHVGAADFATCRLDLSRAVRSPGSALKPFLYGLAFEMGILHPETLVLDRPMRFEEYGPGNFSGQYHGWLTVRQALHRSLNTVAVQVLARIGPGRLQSRFGELGLRTAANGDPGLALALGGTGTTLREMVGLYAALADQGRFRTIRFVPGSGSRKESGQGMLLSPQAAWYVDDILRTMPVPPGFDRHDETAARIRYKTGTSYGYRDAWAMGYDRCHTIGVWAGRPDGGATDGYTGARVAVPVLFQLFSLVQSGRSALPDPGPVPADDPPPGVLMVHDNSKLPAGLRRFNGTAVTSQSDAPRINYPVDGSILSLGTGESSGLVVTRQGGVPPFTWLVNGRPVSSRFGTGESIRIHPREPGQLTITVLDRQGRHDRVSVWIE